MYFIYCSCGLKEAGGKGCERFDVYWTQGGPWSWNLAGHVASDYYYIHIQRARFKAHVSLPFPAPSCPNQTRRLTAAVSVILQKAHKNPRTTVMLECS